MIDFKEINDEFAGWTILQWDSRSEFGETTRIICEKDGIKKAVHFGSNDLGMWLEAVHEVNHKGTEIWDCLNKMCYQLRDHRNRVHEDWYSRKSSHKSEPIRNDYSSANDYAEAYLDYWINNDSSVLKVVLIKSDIPNEYHYILVDEATYNYGTERELFTVISNQDGAKFEFLYVQPEEVDELLDKKIPLPKEFSAWQLDVIKTIDNPYFINWEDDQNEEVERNKSDFEVLTDVRNALIGYQCQQCNKEWWISLRNIKKCDNEKLRVIMQYPETRLDVFDERKYESYYEEDDELGK